MLNSLMDDYMSAMVRQHHLSSIVSFSFDFMVSSYTVSGGRPRDHDALLAPNNMHAFLLHRQKSSSCLERSLWNVVDNSPFL